MGVEVQNQVAPTLGVVLLHSFSGNLGIRYGVGVGGIPARRKIQSSTLRRVSRDKPGD